MLVNIGIGILKPLYTVDRGIVELVDYRKGDLLLLAITKGDLFSSGTCAIIRQRDLERMGYPMPRPVFQVTFIS